MENGIYLIECGNGVVTMRRVAVLGDGEEVIVRKKSWKRDWYSLQDENAELKRKLDVVRSERMSYSKQVDGLREHAAIREQVVKDSGEQLDLLQERFADLRGKLEDTQKALDEERHKRADSERERDAAVARNDEILNELQRTTECLKQARQAAAEADRRADADRRMADCLQRAVLNWKANNEKLSKELASATERMRQALGDAAEAGTRATVHEVVKESYRVAEEQLDAKNKRIAELEQQLAQAEADIETWRAQALTLERTSVGMSAGCDPAIKVYGEPKVFYYAKTAEEVKAQYEESVRRDRSSTDVTSSDMPSDYGQPWLNIDSDKE